MLFRGYDLFSWMAGNLPSCPSISVGWEGRFRIRFGLVLATFLSLGWSSPMPVISAPSSSSLSSIFDLIASKFSVEFAPLSSFPCSRRFSSRKSRFSASNVDVSISRFRMRTACVWLTRARSRFCRRNLLLTNNIQISLVR